MRGTVTRSWLRQLLFWFTVGRYGELPQEGEVKAPQSNPWPSSLPLLLGLWLENGELANCPGVFNF